MKKRVLVFWLAALSIAMASIDSIRAQTPACRYFKVQANTANISKEARDDSVFIDLIDKGEIVCVTRDQRTGDREWVYVAHKVIKPGQTEPLEGWTNLRQLAPLSPAEVAAVTGAPAAAAPSPPPPADDVLRFSTPIPFGPYPVNGNSIEHLADSIAQFPPFDGLEESMWKKKCSTCHKWDRQALCEQGASYARNPRNALRLPHPFGGAYKSALMQWAKGGCQP